MVRVHDKIRDGEKMFKYFNQRQWYFSNNKLLQLEKHLNDIDKQRFVINMNEIQDFQSYVDNIMFITKTRTFNESTKSIHSAKKNVKDVSLLLNLFLSQFRYSLQNFVIIIFDFINFQIVCFR